MNLVYNSRLFRFTGLLLGVLVWLANVGNPPTGKTAAPFDGNCNECHGGNNPGGFNGSVTITGMPSTVDPNTTYPLMITLTPTAGSPVRGGYQLVAVDGNNVNAGDLTAGNAQSGTEFFGGREYVEQRGAKNFTGGGPASWNFNWKSPVTAAGNTIKFYFIGNFTNGNNNDSGDFPVWTFETYNFNGPPPVTATISSSTNVSCFGGNNGSATVEPGGGVAPYTYHWSNNQSGQTAVNLTAGTYSVTVTGSSNTGTATATVVITQPPVLNASATASGVLTCTNLSVTGTAVASGGTAPYTYLWSNNETTSQAQLTTPGSNSVTVTDNNGCTKVAFVNVTQNITAPAAVAGPSVALTCAQNTATLNGAGSSTGAGISYLWTASAGGNIVSGANTLTPLVNAAGTYTLRVTNAANGCTSTATTTATSTIQPPTVSVAAGGQLTCVSTSVTLNTTTNAAPAIFTWAGPGGFMSTLQNPLVSASGTYTVTVTNTATGCSNTSTATVAQNITPPTASAAGNTLTCANTTVSINGNSNIPTATYAWTGPNFTSTLQNPTVNMPGPYSLVVTDPANGCTATATATVIQNIATPNVTTTAGQITCANSTANLTVTTNASPAGFAWTGPGGFMSTLQNPATTTAGAYSVVVTDSTNGCTSTGMATVIQNTMPPTASAFAPGNLNCTTSSLQLNGTASSQGTNFTYLWTTANGNIVSGNNTLTPTINAPGSYTLAVTNTANGCTATTNVAVNQSPSVTAGIGNVVNISCNGGSNGGATATGGGGNGSFSYAWSNGANTASIGNLPAGTYIVSVTDGENCTATASVTITQPAVLAAGATVTAETAAGASDGTATALPTGGTPAYTYLWNTNANTPTITGLAPGTYTVSVTDANNCTAVQTVTVNSFNCTLAANIASTNITCNGANNGTATVTLTGAALPTTYTWTNGGTTAMVSNLSPGTYTVQVLDANNCPATLSVNITQPPQLLANASSTNETGLGLNNGTATAAPAGGTAPYDFLWSNGASTAMITGLAPGQYTVSVADGNGCIALQTVAVSAFNCALNATVSIVPVACAGGNNGQATAVPVGATLPVTYAWSNGANTATISNLTAGTYTVILTDAVGCITTSTAAVSEPQVLTASVSGLAHVTCPEDKNGTATVVPGGGTSPYQVNWPNNSNGQNLGVGTYAVSVTDMNGCSIVQSVMIASFDTIRPTITCPTVITISCGGTPIEYGSPSISDNCNLNGAQAELIAGLPSGSVFPVGQTTQVFRVTDGSGNSSTCSFTITGAPPMSITLDEKTPDVNNAGVGSIQVTISGATTPPSPTFKWTKDGEPFATTEDLTGLHAGVYTLSVTDVNGCTATFGPVTIENTVGTGDLEKNVIVRVVPNPVRDVFYLETVGIQPVDVQLVDMHGRMVRRLESAEWTTAIEVSLLSEGMYYLLVRGDNGTLVVVKWIKVN